MIASGAIAAAQEHAHRAVRTAGTTGLEFFDQASAADVAAICNQIIPSTDGPGAAEAGVIYFIDRALTTFDANQQGNFRKAMEEVQAARRRLFPASTSIAALHSAQQIDLIRSIEKTDAFERIRGYTLLGFLADPSYGGNRGKVGWAHIGLEDRMSFEPPFGYYDAEAVK